MRIVSIAGVFIVAMWAIGKWWAAVRAVWTLPTAGGAASVAAYTVVFVAAFAYLGFWVYAADRAAGKVQRTIGLYERVLRRRDRSHA